LFLYFLYRTFGKNTFLLPGQLEVNGSIEATASGQIEGRIRGDVRTTGKLVIGKNAHVMGNVYAADLVSYGKIYGDVFIDNKATFIGRAYVKGDVTAMTLDIEENAVIDGAITKNVSSEAENVSSEAGQEVEPRPSIDNAPLSPNNEPDNESAIAAKSPPISSILEEEAQATNWF
jgi:cytoskeletal protein CcmA (bactofilin family)